MSDDPIALPIVSIVVRTCYGHEDSWQALVDAWYTENGDGFRAYSTPVQDPRLDGLTPEQVVALLPPNFNPSFLVIADETTLTGPDRAALVVDLHRPPSAPPFRVVPAEMWSVENNLDLANMGFEEFAGSCDNGIFRGF